MPARLFLWRHDAMREAKKRSASGDPVIQPAIKRLRADVHQALAIQPRLRDG